MMIASGMRYVPICCQTFDPKCSSDTFRFAAEPTPENLRRADSWADAAISLLLPRIYQGFGAIQLMVS